MGILRVLRLERDKDKPTDSSVQLDEVKVRLSNVEERVQTLEQYRQVIKRGQ